jgi:hypothetical protein
MAVDESQINNVSHYDGDACMRAIEGLGAGKGFCLGSMIKYAWRGGKKASEGVAKDLSKAKWYFDRAISHNRLTVANSGDRDAVLEFGVLVGEQLKAHGDDEEVRSVCADLNVTIQKFLSEDTKRMRGF